jgi:SNF2 family DNA or RNA helicase/uncharacterized Zn finger protein
LAKYGLTWWGEKFLNSLTHIDNENRLPRGRAYATRGAVHSINIKKNKIEARVQGSRPSPYKVKIEIPAFNETDKSILVSTIKDNPYLLSKLLNRELPEELLDIATSQKIQIFPSSWRSFEMKCSCPDYAVPCKHIASVIYIIANEIDKNPFLVFDLHDFDIIKELAKQNLSVKSQTNELITKFESVFNVTESVIADVEFDKSIYDYLDFTEITDIREDLLSLLSTNPLFFDKDFKEIISAMYKSVAKNTNAFPGKHSDMEYYFTTNDYDKKLQIVYNADTRIESILLNSDETQTIFRNEGQLIDFIKGIEFKNIGLYTPEVILIHTIYQFCLRLLESSAFIPQLFMVSENNYVIRWIPAVINEQVLKVFEQILSILPSEMTALKIITDKKTVISYQNRKETLLSLCSVFLNYFIKLIFVYKNYINYNNKNYKIPELFFSGKKIQFSDFSEIQIPNTIQLWINKYYISHKEYVPLLKIDEQEMNFTLDVLIENRIKSLTEPIALNKFLTQNQYASNKFDVLKDLTLLSEHFPDLKHVIETSGKKNLRYSSESFVEILLKILPSIKLFGINILLPKSLKQLVKPQLSLMMKSTGKKDKMSYFNLDSLLEFDWKIAIGDETIDSDEFFKLIKGMSGLIKIKDKFIFIDQYELDKLYKNLNNPPQLTTNDILKTALSEEYDSAKITLTDEARKIIQEFINAEKIDLPNELKANLRTYQNKGYEWLYKNSTLGFGSLIADDMGLGKTLQVISTLLKFKQEGKFNKKHSLIIVPTTILTNWKKEIERFAPELKAFIYHGAKRELEIDESDVVITSYGTIRNDIAKLKKLHIHTLVIDEAQNIKNPNTEQTKAVKQLKADVKIAMTGTPVENRLSEYWSIFDFINKGYLASLKHFIEEFANPIQIYRDHEKLEKFRKITQPFILRRLKSDKNIIKDLPDKIENNQYCSLTKEQTAIYQNVLDGIMKTVEDSEGIQRKGLVLKLMTALKQICNHPTQYLKKGTIDPELSGKTMLLFNILENIIENNEKTLIFTQYKEMGDILVKLIEDNFKVKTMFLHGGTTRKQRDEMVNNFQEKKNLRIFILSLKAGGTGLNLTAASNVIHYDLWWNPAVEHQATDRAYRIGQKSNVMVYRLLTKGTFEEKIDEMLKSKMELADLTVTTGEKWIGDLSNKELKELVSLSE